MRLLIGFLLWMLLMPTAQGQEARVRLQDGSVLQGGLVAVTDDHVQLRVEGRVITIPIARIVDFTEIDTAPTQPAATPGPAAPGPGAAQPVSVPNPRPRPPSQTLFGSRLGWLPYRYAWIPSGDATTMFSVGILTFLILSVAIHFGTRLAGMESQSFNASCFLSFLVMVAAGTQVAFVPATPIAVLLMVVGNSVMWMMLNKVILQANFAGAIAIAIAIMICGVISFAILELVDSILGMVDEGAARRW
jgi:hypothetical protein